VGSEKEAAILAGHSGRVASIAFHPDGAVLASAGDDGAIKLWKLETGTLLQQILAHDEPITGLAFSPDGKRLASASQDGFAKTWNVSNGDAQPRHTLEGHTGKVYGVSFSPDGRRLASAGHDGKCIIWSAATGEIQEVFQRSAGPVMCAAFDPSGDFLAMGGDDQAIVNLKRRKETLLAGHERKVFSVAFSPDGSRLVSSSQDGTAKVWNISRGREIANFKGHLAPVTRAVFSPAGDRIASTGWDGSVKVWDPDSGQETLSLKGQKSGRAYSVAFSPDGRYLASANHDGTITVWGR
jgi:WD40 repeat protein